MTDFLLAIVWLLILVVTLSLGAFVIVAVFSTALRLRRRWLGRLLVVVFSLVLVGGLALCGWGYLLTRQIHGELSRIAAAGEPIELATPAAIAVMTHDLEEPDAGRLYAAASELRHHNKRLEHSDELGEIGRVIQEGRAGDLADAQRPILDALLDANQESLALLDRATAMDRVRPINTDRNSFFMLGALSGPRGLASLANLRTMDCLADGRGDEAADSVLAIIRCHRILKEDSLIAHMVKVAIVALGASRAAALVQYESVPSQKLSRLDAALREAEGQLSLHEALMGERELGLALLGVIPGAAPTAPASNFPWPFGRAVVASYLFHLRDSIEAARQPFPAVLDALAVIKPRGLFGGTLHPSFERSGLLLGRSYASIRAARLAIAIELYRREHGKPPEQLTDLAPRFIDQLPADPFDGKPMRYKLDGKAILLYSVNNNRMDDGGIIESKDGKGDPPDWGLRVRLK